MMNFWQGFITRDKFPAKDGHLTLVTPPEVAHVRHRSGKNKTPAFDLPTIQPDRRWRLADKADIEWTWELDTIGHTAGGSCDDRFPYFRSSGTY